MKTIQSGAWSPQLDAIEQETLFSIGSDTLQWCTGSARAKFSFDAYVLTPALEQSLATFVTIKIGNQLRGCIGSLEPVTALYGSVHDNAIHAALHDPRFPAVTRRELDEIDMHISILSPIVDIASLDDFRLGEHGIIMEKGLHRAVFLPEVAPEQGWTREDTLMHLSLKAGCEPDAWRKGARFKVFSSVVLER